MRKLFVIIGAAAILLAACKSPEKKAEEQAAKNLVEGLTEMAKSANKVESKVEDLKKLTPISNEALKSFLPEELAGMRRSNFNVTNAMGFAAGEAEYKQDDTSQVRVTVHDCAGEAGSAFYSMQYFLRLNMEQENDNGYTKAVDFMDSRAVETYDKSANEYNLVFLAADRFLVSVEGENVELGKVKETAKSLDYDKLKSLK